MKTLDLRKIFKHLYSASRQVQIVDVPEMNFLMIDGRGDPNTSESYGNALETLYNVAYNLKFVIKKEDSIDYPVMSLEGLWWIDDMSKFSMENKEAWSWTMMIMQPECVTEAKLQAALQKLGVKKKLPSLKLVRLERYNEGLSAQIIHIGSYSEEGPTTKKLHDFIRDSGA